MFVYLTPMLKKIAAFAAVAALAVACAPVDDPNELTGSAEESETADDGADTGESMSMDDWQAQANTNGSELSDALEEPTLQSTMPGQGFGKIMKVIGSISIVSKVKIPATINSLKLVQLGSFANTSPLSGLIPGGSGILSNLASALLDGTQKNMLGLTVVSLGSQAALDAKTPLEAPTSSEKTKLVKKFGGTAAQYGVYVPPAFAGSNVSVKSRQFVKTVSGKRSVVAFQYTFNGQTLAVPAL